MRSTSMPPASVVLFYAGESLAGQVAGWAIGRRDCTMSPSLARSASGIRKAMERARLAVVDATEDPSRACETFAQAAAQRGADAVVVYTESMYDGLELFVRSRGGLLLLGPMAPAQWEGFLRRRLGLSPSKRRRTDDGTHAVRRRRPLGKSLPGRRMERTPVVASWRRVSGVKAK